MRSVTLSLQLSSWSDGQSLRVLSGLPGPGPVESIDGIEQWTGHFAAIEVSETTVSVAVDRMRSYPLFYEVTGETVRITDDPQTALDWASSLDRQAGQELLMAGFVTGPRTVFSNIKQVEAGTTVHIDRATGDERFDVWGLSLHEEEGQEIADGAYFDAELERVVREAIERLLAQAGDRRLVLPLSGGLDSRLLVAHLRLLGVENVTCFTYGRPGSPEMQLSRAVAESAGYEWHVVDYTPDVVSSVWDRPQTGQWMRETWACSALPHAQDYIALVELLHKGIIPEDSVILPGHTVVGNMHDEYVLEECPYDAQALQEIILKHHFKLVPSVTQIPQSARTVIRDFFELIAYDGSPRSVRDAIENYNLRERQAKYINNSARTYDFLGLGWSYPMIDTEVYQLWTRGCAELTVTRDMYARHVARLYQQATGVELSLHEERTVALSTTSRVRSTAESFLRATRLMPVASHMVRLWGHLHHPLGFNLMLREPGVERLARTLRLEPILGRWSRAFVTDSWGPRHHLFDKFRK